MLVNSLQNSQKPLYTLSSDYRVMVDDTITTGVDDLIELLRGKNNLSMQDAAKALDPPEEEYQPARCDRQYQNL